jgi:two-component sensor histidine kinase
VSKTVDLEQRVKPPVVADYGADDSAEEAPPMRMPETSKSELAVELAGALELQRISTRLIREKDLDALYREIVAAAMAIMRSDFGSMQVYDSGRNALYLLVNENFAPESAKYWEWVNAGESSSCGMALTSGERIVVTDAEQCAFMAGTEDLVHYRRCGMNAVQSTPLISREGQPIGMISTHWKTAHAPAEEELRMLDVLARQAADLIERTQAEERRKLLVNELNHRVKNTLSIVQALAQQTFRGSKVPKDIRDAFEGRLEALASTHDLLTRTHWESTDLNAVVHEALAACGVSDRATVKGPPLLLGASTAVTFAMALHELCTNAIKYGALSAETGRVSIAWAITATGERRFEFEWRESGGPQVAPPGRRGFGTRLIERALASDLKGETKLDFRPEGVRFRLDAPLPAQTLSPPS